jgi:hypothetical protein
MINKEEFTMKRTFIALALLLAVTMGASAQSWKDLLGKAAGEVVKNQTSSDGAGGAVVNILGSLLGKSTTLTVDDIAGTWLYQGSACVLESEQALSNLGGTLVTSQIEKKFDGYLTKIGVVPGVSSFTFAKDGSCAIKVGNYNIAGTFTLLPDEKMIDFTFLYGQVNVKTYIAYEITDLNVVFNADKLLSLIKGVTAALSKDAPAQQVQQLASVSQTAGAVGTLLNSYDGMMLGVKLQREASATSTSNSTGNAVVNGLKGLFK